VPTGADMDGVVARALWRMRLGGAFAWSMPLYWLVVFPHARRELREWERRAHQIPDRVLREQALGKLRSEAMTAEGAAAFAILATVRSCRHVVTACIAFEVIYDYVDALAEEPVADVLANNRLLYGALVAAFALGGPVEDWYARHPRRDDGGYLRALVETCRHALSCLPSHEQVRPCLLRSARRAGEAQSLHHATSDDERALASWAADQQPGDCTLRWWELAAASGSPLGFFALLAAAAHRRTGSAEAAAIEDAYFPWIAALSWLLESLVDQQEDAESAAHSYVAHYGSPQSAARRLATIADHAAGDTRRLPQAGRHALLLAGMAGMYLSEPGADDLAAREAADAVRRTIGGPIVPLLWILRMRRRVGRAAQLSRRPRRLSTRRAAGRRYRAPRLPRRARRRR
jgi:tetraprenyl-beta-curcumene synthase